LQQKLVCFSDTFVNFTCDNNTAWILMIFTLIYLHTQATCTARSRKLYPAVRAAFGCKESSHPKILNRVRTVARKYSTGGFYVRSGGA